MKISSQNTQVGLLKSMLRKALTMNLQASDNAKCENDYDPWNLIGVSWRDYGDASVI